MLGSPSRYRAPLASNPRLFPSTRALCLSMVGAVSACQLVGGFESFTGAIRGPEADAGANASVDADATIDAGIPAYVAEVLADQPSLYYRFEDAVGPTVRDEIGQHPGTLFVPAVAAQVDGAFPGSHGLHVTAESGIAVGTYLQLSTFSSFTLETWLKADVIPSNYSSFLFSDYGTFDDGGRSGFGLFLSGPSTIELDRIDVEHPLSLTYGAATVGTWMHIVLTYDASVYRLYVDGAPRATLVGADVPAITARSSGLTIGTLTATLGQIEGTLDEVAVYATALDGNRVHAHFAASGRFD